DSAENHYAGGHDSIEEGIDGPGQMDVSRGRDLPVVEPRNDLKSCEREDDVSRRDDGPCVSPHIQEGVRARISILEIERGGRVPEEIRERDIDDHFMHRDLSSLRIAVVLAPALLREEIRAAARG